MFTGRREERKQLESLYQSSRNNLLLLYGRRGTGKTALCLEFTKDKAYCYFRAGVMTDEAQTERFIEATKEISGYRGNEKLILIADEYQLCAVEGINRRITELLESPELDGRIMIILVSSSISWVENRMANDVPIIKKKLTGIIRLTEISFRETVEFFPDLSSSDLVVMRSCLGGVPRYLRMWDREKSVKENIVALFLDNEGPLINETELILKSELRELAAYNSILGCLAAGCNKLNDIYAGTGFSRAKISVYLKNLIEMDIVEKVYSVNVKHYENTQKGIYKIKDRLIYFYYAFIYPHTELIEQGAGEKLFDRYVLPDMDRFVRDCFAGVAREYLEIVSKRGMLTYRYNSFRTWFGKMGVADLIACDDERHRLAAFCFFDDRQTDMSDYRKCMDILESAGIACDDLCLFSKTGFSGDIKLMSGKQGFSAIELNDL